MKPDMIFNTKPKLMVNLALLTSVWIIINFFSCKGNDPVNSPDPPKPPDPPVKVMTFTYNIINTKYLMDSISAIENNTNTIDANKKVFINVEKLEFLENQFSFYERLLWLRKTERIS